MTSRERFAFIFIFHFAMNTKLAILWLALIVAAFSQCSGNVGL
jgi:hypothetical protein